MKKLIESFKIFVRTIGIMINTPPAMLPPHCSNISSLLLHLCDFDHVLHKWVLRWIAYPLRHPGAKMSTCLVFNGGEGKDKEMFFEQVVSSLHGPFARQIQGHHLNNISNAWASEARLVIVDGEYSRGVVRHLKLLLTGTHHWIYRKGEPERLEENQINFIYLSGAIDFLPIEASDRRFVVIEVPPPQSPFFYRAVADEIANGCIEAFRHYLLHELDMGEFNERTRAPTKQFAPACMQAA